MTVLFKEASWGQVAALAQRLQRLAPDVLGTDFLSFHQAQLLAARALGHTDIGEAQRYHGGLTKHFSTGSARVLTQDLNHLMEEADESALMWQHRALLMAHGVLSALTFLRDQHGVPLNAMELRTHLKLEALHSLAYDSRLPVDLAEALQAYLKSIPCFVDASAPETSQCPITMEQHGYLESQFSRMMA